jgi:acetone carboxylase gamma subunit
MVLETAAEMKMYLPHGALSWDETGKPLIKDKDFEASLLHDFKSMDLNQILHLIGPKLLAADPDSVKFLIRCECYRVDLDNRQQRARALNGCA